MANTEDPFAHQKFQYVSFLCPNILKKSQARPKRMIVIKCRMIQLRTPWGWGGGFKPPPTGKNLF